MIIESGILGRADQRPLPAPYSSDITSGYLLINTRAGIKEFTKGNGVTPEISTRLWVSSQTSTSTKGVSINLLALPWVKFLIHADPGNEQISESPPAENID